MLKQPSIQLHIPTPCHEDWQAMTPCEQGRFCGSCQKTVIDFTSWSDKALYEFFKKSDQTVCGRVKSTQLKRTIALPPQPRTKLYRLAIALGLTLIFTQAPTAYSKVQPQIEILSLQETDTTKPKAIVTDSTGAIIGTATDENGEPIIGALIEVIDGKDGVKGRSVTNIDGKYAISNLPSGRYSVTSKYGDYTRVRITDIKLTAKKEFVVNLNFKPNNLQGGLIIYQPPLSDKDGVVRPRFSREDIKNMSR